MYTILRGRGLGYHYTIFTQGTQFVNPLSPYPCIQGQVPPVGDELLFLKVGIAPGLIKQAEQSFPVP